MGPITESEMVSDSACIMLRLGSSCLTLFATIFQLYRDGQFYLKRKLLFS